MIARIFALVTLTAFAHLTMAQPDSALCAGDDTQRTVCNMAWNGCKPVAAPSMPHCKSAANALASISAKGPGALDISLLAVNKDFAVQTLLPIKPQSAVGNIAKISVGPFKAEASTGSEITQAAVDAAAAETARTILAKLDLDPLDEAAQGSARDVVRKCKDAKTLLDMYKCSGMFVPPIVRLNCLNNGPCLPLPWGSTAVPNGKAEWWGWQQYRDEVNVRLVALARPWVTTPEQVERCAKEATKNGVLDNAKATFCLVKKLGGAPAQQATACYSKWANNPAQFSGCLGGMTLSAGTVKQVDCVLRKQELTPDCIVAMKTAEGPTLKCVSAAKGDPFAIAKCMEGVPPSVTNVSDCAKKAGGDASLLGHCLKGAAALNSPTLFAIEKCALGASKAASGPELQRALLVCGKASKGNVAQALKALDDGKTAISCVSDPQKPTAEKAQCLQAAGIQLPPQAATAQCLATAKTGLDAATCAGLKGAAQAKRAKECLDTAQGDTARAALCIGAGASLPPEQARLVSCAASATTYASGAACMAGPYMNKDAARALSCAADSQGSPAGTAICMAGPEMNAELRIAAECLASTGGEPISFASCAGGRLAMKELQQCIAGGFKAENGCFGENNEIVKYFSAQEKVFRGLMKTVGLEKAYDNVLNDLKSGKLGENNDARRVFETINRVTLMEPTKAAADIAKEAAKAGEQIVGGVEHLKGEIEKTHKEVVEAVQKALPPAPSVAGKTDLPGGGSAEVTLKPGGGSVSVGNNGASVGPGGSGHVKVGGVKICSPFGC